MSSAPQKDHLPPQESPLFLEHPLPAWIIDAVDFSVRYVNKAAAAQYGYVAAGVQQVAFTTLLTPSCREAFTGAVAGGAAHGIYELVTPDGQVVPVQLYSAPVGLDDRPCLQLSAVPAPPADRARESLLATLVEQSSDVLTAADTRFYPVTWNRAAARLYGLTAEQVIGRDLRTFIDIQYHGTDREAVRAAIAAEGEWRGEASFIRPTDGRRITLIISFKRMHDAAGTPIGYIIGGTDITERKAEENRLLESEIYFRELADCVPVMIWMTDMHNRISYLNKNWLAFTGKDLTGCAAEAWMDCVHPDDLALAKSHYDRGYALKEPITTTYRLQSCYGDYRWVQDTCVPRYGHDGSFAGYIGSVIDIEGQKRVEAQLRHQAIILENVSDTIVTTDLEFSITGLNRIAEEYYGIREHDALGRKTSEILKLHYPETSRDAALATLIDKGIWKGETCMEKEDGATVYFSHTVKVLFNGNGQPIGYLAVGRDITEKKIAGQRLLKSEQFYRTLIAESLDGILLLDRQGTISFASPSMAIILGYNPEELQGQNGFEYVHPDDLAWAMQAFQKEVGDNPEVKFIVVRLKHRQGHWQWCMVRGHNQLNNPSLNSLVIHLHDDTLRKQATDALKESERRFRTMVGDLQMGIMLADAEGRFIMVNKALCRLFDTEETALVGKNIYNFVSSDFIDEEGRFIPMDERPLAKALQTNAPVRDVVMGVIHPTTGERLWLLVNADPVLDEQGAILHIICSIKDLTERKRLEQAIMQEQLNHQKQLTQASIDGQEAERREIGRELHDNIGQQLTTIKLFLDMAKTSADESTMEMISLALKGIGDVINEIRTMSRTLVPYSLKDLGLLDCIMELVESIERTQTLQIEVAAQHFNEDLMPENQRLSVFRVVQEQLNNIQKHADAEFVKIHLQTAEDLFRLTITDDGQGFQQGKVKPGLGLKNIQNRAEIFGGTATVTTAPGKGCRLEVVMPIIPVPTLS